MNIGVRRELHHCYGTYTILSIELLNYYTIEKYIIDYLHLPVSRLIAVDNNRLAEMWEIILPPYRLLKTGNDYLHHIMLNAAHQLVTNSLIYDALNATSNISL